MNDQITTTIVTTAHKAGVLLTAGSISLTVFDVIAYGQMAGAITGAIIGTWTLCDMVSKWLDKRKKRGRK